MEKKMVYGLLIPFAHATTINYNDMHIPYATYGVGVAE
jgi:hypothetical protein